MSRIVCEHLWPDDDDDDDDDAPCPDCMAQEMPWKQIQDHKDLRIQTLEARVAELEQNLRWTQRELNTARSTAEMHRELYSRSIKVGG